jgi:hypothetical protein
MPEFDNLVKRTEGMDEEAKKIEYIVWLVDRAGTIDIADELIKEAGSNSVKT